jgi:hypothetical protein
MSGQDRGDGSPDVARPFVPRPGPTGHQEDIAEALDHIARALSAIDQKLTIVLAELDSDSLAVNRLASSLEDKTS